MPKSKTAGASTYRRLNSANATVNSSVTRRRSARLRGKAAEPILVSAKKTRPTRKARSAKIARQSRDTTSTPTTDASHDQSNYIDTIGSHIISDSEGIDSVISGDISTVNERRRRIRRGGKGGERASSSIGFSHLRPSHPSHQQDLDFVVEMIIRQLKNMPREYCRILVTAEKYGYQTLVITDPNSKRKQLKNKYTPSSVIGAVVYRYICEKKIVELAYCVMLTESQGKGYGRILMARLIEEMRGKNVDCILTYADNDAIGYFRKHGFTLCQNVSELDSVISVPRSEWYSSIFHYDGATLMYCSLNRRRNHRSMVSDSLNNSADRDGILAAGDDSYYSYGNGIDMSALTRVNSAGGGGVGGSNSRMTRFSGRGKGSLSTTAARHNNNNKNSNSKGRGLSGATLGIRTPQTGWISRISIDEDDTIDSDAVSYSLIAGESKSRKRKFDFSDDHDCLVTEDRNDYSYSCVNQTNASGGGMIRKRRRCGSAVIGRSHRIARKARLSSVDSSSQDDAISVDESSSCHDRSSEEPHQYSDIHSSAASSVSSVLPPLVKQEWSVRSMVAQESSLPDTMAAWRGRLRRRSGCDSPHKHYLKIGAQSSIAKQCRKLDCGLSSICVSLKDNEMRKRRDEIEAFVRFERLAQSHSDFDIVCHLKDYYQMNEKSIKRMLNDINSSSDRMVEVNAMSHALSSSVHHWAPLTPKSWIITVCAEPRINCSRIKFFRYDECNRLERYWTGVELKQHPRYSITGRPDLFGWFYSDEKSESAKFKLYGHQTLSYVSPFEMEPEMDLPRISDDFGQFEQITESLRQSRIREACTDDYNSNSNTNNNNNNGSKEVSQSADPARSSYSTESSLSISGNLSELELSPGASSTKSPRRSARLADKSNRSTMVAHTPIPSVTSPIKSELSTAVCTTVTNGKRKRLRLKISRKDRGMAECRDKYGRQWFKLPTSVLRELCWRNHAEFRYCLNPTNSDFVDFYSSQFT